MTCKEFRALLTDHLVDELLAEVRAKFDSHRGDCTHCGYFLESFTFTVRVTRLLPREMPPGLEERLRTAVTKALAEEPAAGN